MHVGTRKNGELWGGVVTLEEGRAVKNAGGLEQDIGGARTRSRLNRNDGKLPPQLAGGGVGTQPNRSLKLPKGRENT